VSDEPAGWEHFAHEANVGVRGFGPTREAAFEPGPVAGARADRSAARASIVVRSHSTCGVAEEAPGAYKDVGAVVAAAERAGLARRVARLKPLISIKG
jgi:RNA-splicing ligase RtcB